MLALSLLFTHYDLLQMINLKLFFVTNEKLLQLSVLVHLKKKNLVSWSQRGQQINGTSIKHKS